MQFGALGSLAEVGVGINLAFGIVQQFRQRLRDQLFEKVEDARLRMEVALAEANLNGDVGEKLEEIGASFGAWTTVWERWFMRSAICAGFVLIAFLAYMARHNGDRCDPMYTWFVLSFAVGPVLVWWCALWARHQSALRDLDELEKRHTEEINTYKKLAARSIIPTNPE
jgi:hypothetical protein